MIIRRATGEDVNFLTEVFSHPDMWRWLGDDNTPPLASINLQILLDSTVFSILIPDKIGFFMFHPWNSTTFEMHSAVLPAYRGKPAMEGARLAGHWMFDNTTCRKIVTLVPRSNIRAKFLARKGGMHEEGMITRSFLKDGQMIDQYLYGICKEEVAHGIR